MKVREDVSRWLFGRAKCGILIAAMLVPFSPRVTNCVIFFFFLWKRVFWPVVTNVSVSAYCLHFRGGSPSTVKRRPCVPQKLRNHLSEYAVL